MTDLLLIRTPEGAAAAAKSLQSCPTLCDPIDGSPPGSAVPGILQVCWYLAFPYMGELSLRLEVITILPILYHPFWDLVQCIIMVYWFEVGGVLFPGPPMLEAL